MYAHSKVGVPVEDWHKLTEHLNGVSTLSQAFSDKFGSGFIGKCLGKGHDIGKAKKAFFSYLLHENGLFNHPDYQYYTGNSPHSAEGAALIKEQVPGVLGALMSLIVAGHHSGLSNTENISLPESISQEVIDFGLSCIGDLKPPKLITDKKRYGFQVSFFGRMLFSCLVDADYLDTERFYRLEYDDIRGSYSDLPEIRDYFLKALEVFSATAPKTQVNTYRKNLLEACTDFSSGAPGFYALNSPTGGGKTLSSMAFALNHAVTHGKERIICAIPYTSIIEQTAEMYRRFMPKNSVLEHHASFDFSNDLKSRLSSENWDVPVVVTTTVQLFDSLFANKSSKCRKLHNLCNSVLILDEVQALPVKNLLPCITALKELVLNYGVTVLLCSATQPAFFQRPGFKDGIPDVTEIRVDGSGSEKLTKRTSVVVDEDPKTVQDLSEVVCNHVQILMVCNTKSDAREVFKACGGLPNTYHLSASMCPKHRSSVLKTIKDNLKSGLPCRVVSTQVVEAGVDLDFPVVWRCLSGIDSIVQAAGRCNREGKLDKGSVTVYRLKKKTLRGDLLQREDATEIVLPNHLKDLCSEAAIFDFFKEYYTANRGKMDQHAIVYRDNDARTAGHFFYEDEAKFRFIDDITSPIIVLYDNEAKKLKEDLDKTNNVKYVLRRLQAYTVSVYDTVLDKLKASGGITEVKEGIYFLTKESLYDCNVGLDF